MKRIEFNIKYDGKDYAQAFEWEESTNIDVLKRYIKDWLLSAEATINNIIND